MSDIFAVDIETAGEEGNEQFALEPFRLLKGRAEITDISISGPDNYNDLIKHPTPNEILDLLSFLKGKTTYFHNALFDVAWLYAAIGDIEPLTQIGVRDTMLLAKWLQNGQSMEYAKKDEDSGYTLLALVNRFCAGDPKCGFFNQLKKQDVVAGEDSEYWELRATMDTYFTRKVAIELQRILPGPQRNGFLISMKALPYVARSWVNGTPFDYERASRIAPQVEKEKQRIASDLGIQTSVIQSAPQLAKMLFEDWGLEPIKRGKPKKGYPNGQGSTAADDLKMIALRAFGTSVGPKMKLIMDYKKLQTLQTKYLNGLERVYNYIGDSVCYGSPRMFGTYTGRFTYSSKTQRKQLWQVAIAMHQLPRKGPAKALMLPPEGCRVGKYDASGQEIAFMAWASRDENMTSVLNQGMNIHSWMATNITGEDYNSFISRLKNEKDAYETRQAAKLTNLSCQYRIGWKALQSKFFGTYDKNITQQESNRYLNMYKASYPGVPRYWKSIVLESMNKGYAETIAGRRYYLTDWDTHRWGTESSAINTPIQGSGADQKDLVIWLVSEKFPEIRFTLDIHDEGIFYLPESNAEELNKEIVHFLNAIDYSKYWNTEIPMPLTFEGQLGDDFKNCEEYAQPWDDIVAMRKSLCI